VIARCGCSATGWAEAGESKLGAGRHVGATGSRTPNGADGLGGPASSRGTDSEEVRALKRRAA
jgi:hypothetical protein